MVIGFGAVVQHRHDVRIVVLVVVVERVEEDAEAVPLVRAAEDRTLEAFSRREPEGKAVGADAAAAGHSELNLNFPPVECAKKEIQKDVRVTLNSPKSYLVD